MAVVHGILAPPIISHDTIIGLKAWHSLREGASWNHIKDPDLANISQDVDAYLSWWSPGQYVPVGILVGPEKARLRRECG